MKNGFYFSVVTAVYNAELFLPETVDSLLRQDIGFSNIQLILCDDGSTDGSGAMCDAYAAQYPENVVVIHKENGGVSSARNAGLERVEGKYVSFLDADDLLQENAMSEVYRFFENHPETDVVSLPMEFFDGKRGGHPLNYKYLDGTRVIDLDREPNNPQLAVTSVFVRAAALEGKSFDTRLSYAEDANLLQSILIEKKTLGVVADSLHLYRRRSTGEASAIQRSGDRPVWYLPYFRHFCLGTIHTCLERLGYVPRFVQYTLVYDMQWRIRQQRIPSSVLSEEEKEEYRKLFAETYSYMDDDVIATPKYQNVRQKAYALYLKHKALPTPVGTVKEHLYRYPDGSTVPINPSGVSLDFFDVGEETFTLEGTFIHERVLSENPAEYLLSVNDTFYPCERIDRKSDLYLLDEPIAHKYEFRATVPISEAVPSYTIRVYRKNELGMEPVEKPAIGNFFPIEKYKSAYAFFGGRVLRYSGGALILEQPKHSPLGYELRMIRELWKIKVRGTRGAAIDRFIRLLMKPFFRKPIWILSDRMNVAGDNGEALFRYLNGSGQKHARVYFTISRDCPDYKRLKKIGRVLALRSRRHKRIHLLSSCIISSQADKEILKVFTRNEKPYRDILSATPFVFLQHGVIKDDLSDWLNRYNKNISGFVTSARPETDSIRNGDYFYPPETIWETGLPRFDRLYHDEQKQITIMPTWRHSWVARSDMKTGIRYLRDGFEEGSFYQFFNRLLNDERLFAAAKACGYRVCFLPHPLLQPHMDLFTKNDAVQFIPANTPYRDVFAKSDLIVTDYSSVAFDFAYLRKPVVYTQFDRDEFYSGEHMYTKGYFDYERDGFGEVETEYEATVDRLIEYMKNGCQLKDQYRARIDGFFAYDDRNNCQRVYERIRALEAEQAK